MKSQDVEIHAVENMKMKNQLLNMQLQAVLAQNLKVSAHFEAHFIQLLVQEKEAHFMQFRKFLAQEKATHFMQLLVQDVETQIVKKAQEYIG